MGKIKKILENELVGGTQNTDVYPVTSVKAVYDENNERLDNILKRRGTVNISTNYNADHIAEVLTLAQAIAKVPSADRVLGFSGTFLSADGWVTYTFKGETLSEWSNAGKWSLVSDSANLAQGIGDSKELAISQKAVKTEVDRLDYNILNVLVKSDIGTIYLNTNCNFDAGTGVEKIEYSAGRLTSDKFPIASALRVTNNKGYLIAIRYYSDINSNVVLKSPEGAGAARLVIVASPKEVDSTILDGLIITNHGVQIYGRISTEDIPTKAYLEQSITEANQKVKDIIVNKVINNISGDIVDFRGRFQITRLFATDSNVMARFTPNITAFFRYYDKEGTFLGSSYTPDAKFVKIGGIVDESRETTEDEVAKYVLSINGQMFRCVQGLTPEIDQGSAYVTTDQMKNFKFSESLDPVIVGKYISGDNSAIGSSSVKITDDTHRAYIGKIIPATEADTINISISGNDNGLISNVPIRCVAADGTTYMGTVYTNLNGSFTPTAGSAGFYVNFVSSSVLTNDLMKDIVVTINGVDYPLAGNPGRYVNPLSEAKQYTDEEISKIGGITSGDYYNYLVGCFERIVCIGDSITAGYTDSQFAGQNIGSNDARVTARNWVGYFKRTTGSDVINLGYGSTTTTHWRNSTPETEASNLYCALKLADIEGTQAYFIMLGWNDAITTGSASDIANDYNNNKQTFYGNYDNIVRRLHEMKPKAHIFVFTLARGKKNSSYNNAIRYIASLYPSYCHCIDYSSNPFFNTSFFNAVADGTHYSPLGYNAFGNLVRSLVSKYIFDNPGLFKGIPYTADSNVKGTIGVQGLRLSSANLSIAEVGSYETLYAEILPNTAANKTVSWEVISGDSSCVQLIPNQSTMYCTVKGLSRGFAVIRATSAEGGHSATCLVSVASEVVNVTNITLDKQSVSLTVGGSEGSVQATITPPTATNKTVNWTLLGGGNNVATIEGTGLTCLITPRGAGTDTLIARTEDGNREARCTIKVS